jgi:hypothetical protein
MPMEPLTQWWCDACAELIETREQGALEFRYDLSAPEERRHQCFRIVHNGNAGDRGRADGLLGCMERGTDKRGLGDVPLTDFVDGLGVLRMLGLKSTDRTWDETFRRISVPYFEEARRAFKLALADGHQTIPEKLTTRSLKAIIAKYADADR